MPNSRQLAFEALREVHRGAFADVVLDRVLHKAQLSALDRGLATDLVYGSVRRLRTLDALIDQLGKKKSHQQPPDFRTILHLGLYQLRYQQRIPASAAVNSTVQLAKENGFSGLGGVANGLLRNYIRLAANSDDPLLLPENPVERLAILHSYPSWIVETWVEQMDLAQTEQLCEWMNQSPAIDLRVNPLRTCIEEVETALQSAGILARRIPHLPQALRLIGSIGAIQQLPGFSEGWWTVQDSSAQLVGHLLDPQPNEVVIDACAAPGGKTTHIAELSKDQGKVWGCDKTASRLRKLKDNAERLQLKSIQIHTGDSRAAIFPISGADRVLLDAPCSGLGTLHRRADARWQKTPQIVEKLSILQSELLEQVATWVKPGGILVYATCTLHQQENEGVIQLFLDQHPNWQIDPPPPDSPAHVFTNSDGWIKVWPHHHQMDGFFMVRLQQQNS